MTLRSLRLLFALVTLAYAVVTPPFAVPDEQAHWAKAAQLATLSYPNVHHFDQSYALLPADLAVVPSYGLPREDPGVVPNYRAADIARAWQAPSRGGQALATLLNIAAYPPVLYAPQALGILVARAAGLPALGQFYAARMANAAFGIAMVLGALALLPYGRRAVQMIACMPMLGALLASASSDGAIIALAFMAIALALRGAAALPSPWPGRAPVLVLPLLALAKGGLYLPLGLAGLADARNRTPPRLLRLAATLLLAAGAAAAWMEASQGDIGIQRFINRHTLEHASAAGIGPQLGFILGHPLSFVAALAHEIAERLPVYVVGAIGRFGWNALMMPAQDYALAVMVLLGGVLVTAPGEPIPTPGQRLWWVGLGLVVALLIETALYLTATGLGADYVEGVQGRYFIPVLPLFALAARFRPPAAAGRIVDAALPWAAAVLMLGGIATVGFGFWRE
jgi:uncharacterized membrane protein